MNYSNSQLKKLANSNNICDRMLAAQQNYALDILVADNNYHVRLAVLYAAYKTNRIDLLKQLTHDKSSCVSSSASFKLQALKEEQTKAKLSKKLKQISKTQKLLTQEGYAINNDVATYTRLRVKELINKQIDNNLTKTMINEKDTVRLITSRTAKHFSRLDVLETLAHDQSERVRQSAIHAIADLNINLLQKLTNDTSKYTRSIAREILKQLQTEPN